VAQPPRKNWPVRLWAHPIGLLQTQPRGMRCCHSGNQLYTWSQILLTSGEAIKCALWQTKIAIHRTAL